MDFSIEPGIKGNTTKIVEKSDTAQQFGSGMLNVFATPAMIALMEKTAFESIEPLLASGLTTVGISIDVQHVKASLPGSIVTCESNVVKVEGKKVFFEISSSDEKGLIGKCKHTRYVINSAEFMSRI